MPETLCQVWPILHGESDQVGAQVWPFELDNLPACQVGRESLCAAPDGAQRAQQVLFAELGGMELHLVHGEKVPEQQIVAAALNLARHGLMLRAGGHILRYVESAFSCFAVTFNPFG